MNEQLTSEKHVWGIHSLNDRMFLKDNIIALGWSEMGDLSAIECTREAFKHKYEDVYRDSSKASVATSAGMLYRFKEEVLVGDYIIFPSKADRMINIGKVTGGYEYKPDAESSYVNQRKVKWIKHMPRTEFTQGALYEIGAAMTFFSVKNYSEEFLSALDNNPALRSDSDDQTINATAAEIKESTRDFIIKELSRQLKGYPLEELIADLLNAMGYKTTVSKHGGDRGIDIIAYRDELPPRIIVQVKSQDAPVRETTVMSLKGAMKTGDYGLFVSLSGYTPNARKFFKDNPMIRGIDGVALADLILKYYNGLSEKYQDILPMEKVYIPVATK